MRGRLVAYLPGGARLGALPYPLSWSASLPHNDVGALTLTYSTLAAGGEHLRRGLVDGLEVAVEVLAGGAWTEPEGCRCADVLRGLLEPLECPLFGSACTPQNPVGACMVSSEGACAAHYAYGGDL